MFPACIAHWDEFCVCLITSPLASAPEASVQPTNAPHVYDESFVAIFPPRDQREFLRPPLDRLNIRSPWSKKNASHEYKTSATKRAFRCCAASVPKANTRSVQLCRSRCSFALCQC